MPKDLGGFLAMLEADYPHLVRRVTREVDAAHEAPAVVARLEQDNQYPALIFERVKGSAIPVLINLHADFRRLAIALGLAEDATVADFTAEYGRREANPIEPVLVESGPVQDVVLTGRDVDLRKFPLLKYHEMDVGHYISGGLCILRDPDSGIRNAGIYRLMYQGPRQLGIQISETSHGNFIMKKFRRAGKTMGFAVSIGHHPAFILGAESFVPFDVDEFAIAGAMLGEPVRLVKCKTIDCEVPADAEIVLECEMAPDEFAPEAPFGEFPGTYGPQRLNPVVHVKAITMRKAPLWHSILVGHPDTLLVTGVTRLSQIMRTVRIASPTVTAINMPLSGRCRFICYVAMDKLIEGDPKNAAMAAFAADSFLKFVVVVDSDVDIMKDAEVLHAIATRVRADTDTFMVTGARGSPLDPASYDPGGGSHLVTKTGIDATRKPNYPEEIRVPGMDAITLSDWFGADG